MLILLPWSTFAVGVTELQPGQDLVNVIGQASVLVDPTEQLNVNDIETMQTAFVRAPPGDFINPGLSRGIVWVRFELRNLGSQQTEWVFSTNRALLPLGEIYVVDQTGVHRLLDSTASSRTASYKKYGTLAAGFRIDPLTTVRLYVRYRAANWSALDPSLVTKESMQSLTSQKQAIFFLLLGGIISLVAYGSVAFMFLGRQIVAMYALAQLALFAFYAHLVGFTTVYLWPDSPEIGSALSPLSFAIFLAAMSQFARRFFETSSTLPWLDLILRVFVIGSCLGTGLILLQQLLPAIDRRIGLAFVYLLAPLVWLTLPALALFATFAWNKDNWPVAVAWTLMATVIFSSVLAFAGVMTSLPLQKQLYGAAVYTEALFLAGAIALRIRRLREQRALAERRMSASLKSELEASQRATRLAHEREWAIADLAEKGRLLLTTGHDTRQMISALRHFALGLERNPQSTQIEIAGREIAQIADSLNEVLATAIEASASGGMGDHILAMELVKPNQILQPLRLIHAGSAAEKNIELRFASIVDDVVADRVLLSRVLGNFISNAIKYTETGKILVTCRPYQGHVRFQVFDTGIGMTNESLRDCLDPNSGALHFGESAEGSGTGLSIAKDIAARMGGVVTARSTVHRGSVFEVKLPIVRSLSTQVSVGVADGDSVQREASLSVIAALDCRATAVTPPLNPGDLRTIEVLMVDQHYGGIDQGIQIAQRHKGPGMPVIISTYDRSIETRIKLAKAAHVIVYKPLNQLAAKAAISEAIKSSQSYVVS